jgi:hypothetical protein
MNVDPPSILTLRPWDACSCSAVEDLTFSEPSYISIREIGAIPKVQGTIAAFCRSLKISTIQRVVADM